MPEGGERRRGGKEGSGNKGNGDAGFSHKVREYLTTFLLLS